jgi:cytochrome o ubiquinol oxidase subunit IV
MNHHLPVSPQQHASAKTYVFGFIISLLLTVVAYVSTTEQLLAGQGLLVWLLGLAVLQTMVQLWYFLHVGREEKPRWNALFLLNTISVILLIVVASIWIMNSLNDRMMQHVPSDQEIMEEENIYR